MKSPGVSIIVCCYNAAETLRGTLDSLLAQTYEALEVLVVNDASTDETFDIVRSYQEKDSRVSALPHPSYMVPVP